MPVPYRWPLAVSPFTLTDRARIALWTLTQDRYTMGVKVKELENWFSQYSGMHAVMVANGSVANQLVFEMWKYKNPGVSPVVICPAVTWISSITPALSLGLEVVFADVNLTDLALDYDHVARLLHRYKDRRVIIWPTALIGFSPDMARLHRLAAEHGAAEVFLDACEATFSRAEAEYPSPHFVARYSVTVGTFDGSPVRLNESLLASASITTTSTYLSHLVTSVEGGFVFCRNAEDADLARMFRNHGMVRSLAADHPLRKEIEAANPAVDPRFLFAVPGTNLRPSDVHAMFGLADTKRATKARQHREAIYALYQHRLDRDRYYLPPPSPTHVAFCLPVFVRDETKLPAVKRALEEAGIETRPIIGSHLGYQPALEHLFEDPIQTAYPNAEWIHRRGCYVGLHHKVTPAMVKGLTDLLNAL